MVYILAGADGVGKTTLFNELRKAIPDAIFIHESYTSSHEEKSRRVIRLIELAKEDKMVIYDRASMLDDLVYSPITDGEASGLENLVDKMLNAKPEVHTVEVIYIDCDNDEIAKRLESRGDSYIGIEDIPGVKKAYREVLDRLSICPWRLDGAKPVPELVEEAMQIIVKKRFKIAHIVPVGSLSKAKSFGYNMCLANIVTKDKGYAAHFREIASDAFVLMDNGAAEGDQLGIDQLIPCYDYIKPDEIVLPDTLMDCADTYYKSSEAITRLHDHYGDRLPFTLMAVPQGKNLAEWTICAKLFVRRPEIKSIGISKFLEMASDDVAIRLKAAEVLDKLFKEYGRSDMEVHLLGCSEHPSIIKRIHDTYPFVRGCDSAYAYICTQADVPIFGCTARPDGEIDFIHGVDYDKLEDNMQALELAAGAYNNGVDSSWSDWC